jgi:pentose-5-phosphate-3-epimerase
VINKLRKQIDANFGGKILIQVDGGVNTENIGRIVSAGRIYLLRGVPL